MANFRPNLGMPLSNCYDRAINNDIDFSVFPNPANDQIVIEINGSVLGNVMPIYIISSIGLVVFKEDKILKKIETIDVSGLSSGLYYFRIGTSTKRIVVIR